ncbi:cyclopropane-fatty-acyl-phospholipid synthase [Amylibacter kogurei]|uniref:Cyclopropane-fatty-acyl-phospholipid synthase n=1 Tax=Paramylibacter kogurei TaxID=1889778 RepID=A0A2G5K7X1_9RHOB|nr:cyclopropane-fatty-acyl-phospholipid synthase family protein [Amylibacter kogurei]PIB25631.1 cyclopropane-fatty-acyl-phospholipid synthase [Amylibacter kogurei]
MNKLTSTQGQTNLPRYFKQTFALLGAMKSGAIEISLPDGRVFLAQGQSAGPVARLDVINPDSFARLIREGDLGFSDAYLDGWWTTPDLQLLLDVVYMNINEVGYSFPGAGLVRMYERMRHWMRGNTIAQARKNISYHYDLGNAFYAKWLDETMTYSSALFKTGQEDLAKAQIQKYANLCDDLGVKEGDHLLEIGCGWGGFAEYAAAQRGARLKCLTISQEQHDFAKQRIFNAGLSDRVEIVMQDYREERGKYDGVASIEMFEAVGEKYWPVYFETVNNCLKTNGKATLQIITIADEKFDAYRKSVDFIQKYIFPGGMLPSPSALRREIERAGLEFQKSVEFGKSYSLTLRRWFESFNNKWEDIAPLGFDQRFKNMWDFYLAGCASSFQHELTDVTQVTMRKVGV